MYDQNSNSDLVNELSSHLKADLVDYDPASQVAGFFKNRCVFVTGATGFIGKALVEKILRSCREVKRIYLLIREKRGKDSKERLSDLIKSSRIFDRIKSQPGGLNLIEEKLFPINGDITLPKFGISTEDLQELADSVNVVYNCAATIKFVEPIDIAARNNVYSVSQLVEFCNQLKRLQVLIHVSTAYSNSHKKDTIYEIFYEPPMGGDQFLSSINQLKAIQNNIHVYENSELKNRGKRIYSTASDLSVNIRDNSDETNLEQVNEDEDEKELPRSSCTPQKFYERDLFSGQNVCNDLLEQFSDITLRKCNRPNTYTLTKAIAESYLYDLVSRNKEQYLDDKVPVAIVRPSIVGSAVGEPEVGFVDNLNGATGPILALYTGALQAMPGDGRKIIDLVPVDMVTNMLLCSAFYLFHRSSGCDRADCDHSKKQHVQALKRDKGFYIFNFVSGARNPLVLKYLTGIIAETALKFPSKFLVRLPASYMVRAGGLYNLYDFFNHKILAVLMDFFQVTILRKNLSQKATSLVAYENIKQMTAILTPFTSNQWQFNDSNVAELHQQMSELDRRIFRFDVVEINWKKYITNYIIGARIFKLRDDVNSLPMAIRTLKRKQAIANCSYVLFLLLFYFLFLRQSQLESALLSQAGL